MLTQCHRTGRLFALLSPALLLLPAAAAAQCPTPEAAGAAIQRVFDKPIEVRKVTPSRMKGLCEVQVTFQGRANLLYVDAGGEYFLTGHLIDVKSGKDLTEETLVALNSFGEAELQKLTPLTAYTLGKGEKVLYFVTDPQ